MKCLKNTPIENYLRRPRTRSRLYGCPQKEWKSTLRWGPCWEDTSWTRMWNQPLSFQTHGSLLSQECSLKGKGSRVSQSSDLTRYTNLTKQSTSLCVSPKKVQKGTELTNKQKSWLIVKQRTYIVSHKEVSEWFLEKPTKVKPLWHVSILWVNTRPKTHLYSKIWSTHFWFLVYDTTYHSHINQNILWWFDRRFNRHGKKEGSKLFTLTAMKCRSGLEPQQVNKIPKTYR